jgi:hypothetical protein
MMGNLTCPYCEYVGPDTEFDVSLADECFCPKCGREFMVCFDDEGDEEDE